MKLQANISLSVVYTCYMNNLHGKVCGQSTYIQSNTTQVYFNSVNYLYMSATCFSMYLGHPQSCKYKNSTKEDTIRISGAPCHSHHSYNVNILTL